jgi:hypothetical protein
MTGRQVLGYEDERLGLNVWGLIYIENVGLHVRHISENKVWI